jgi:tRNA G10  N-methylase Trm11
LKEKPKILDAGCSIRSFWFDKNDDRAVFLDNRNETIIRKDTSNKKGYRELSIKPNAQADFSNLPISSDTFSLVVFDPPHKIREKANGGFLVQHYGMLNGDWKKMIKNGFKECFRVLKPGGVLIFKWAETEVTVKDILSLTDQRPVIGHKSGKRMGTHWLTFMKA